VRFDSPPRPGLGQSQSPNVPHIALSFNVDSGRAAAYRSILVTELFEKRVGICLGSGYFGFFAHAGFALAMEEIGVTPVAVAGCSAGALAGSFWAAGMRAADVAGLLCSIRLRDFLDLPLPWEIWTTPGGLIRGARFECLLERHLPVDSFEDCRWPFAATVFDIDERRLRIIDSGPLAPAVRASCSMPGMFAPARVDGHLCWDGGTVEKVPVASLADRPDVDAIIVAYVSRSPSRPSTVAAGLRAALHTLINPADQRAVDLARNRGKEVIVVAPASPASGPFRLSRGREIVDLARRDTLRILEEKDFGCPELR